MTAILELFDNISANLEQLSSLARQKTDAVRKDDLITLNQIMRKEQAIALTLRGLDQKRTELLTKHGLIDVPLNDLTARFPSELHVRAGKTIDNLRTQYQIYKSASEVALNTLEINMHEIEKILKSRGIDTDTIGYAAPDIEPPSSMKTDIRA